MNKGKRNLLRAYAIPIMATVTAIVFWWVYRCKGCYWWIILVGVIMIGHYLAHHLRWRRNERKIPDSK